MLTLQEDITSLLELSMGWFTNIAVIWWGLAVLAKETGGPGENHRPVASHWQILSHKFVSSTHRHE